MKKSLALILLLLIAVGLCACGSEKITVPDVTNTDEATAKSILTSNLLIPEIKYIYNDEIVEGNVIATNPGANHSAMKNSKVSVMVSLGPSYIESKDSRITWHNISEKKDNWEFRSPYIDRGVLYIDCDVKFAVPLKWQDDHNDGTLFGNASINDTFDKTVPCSAKYKKQSFKANEEQSFTLEIPLTDLEVNKPTQMFIELNGISNDKDVDVNISFTMTW